LRFPNFLIAQLIKFLASLQGNISICRIRDFLRGSLLRTPRAYFIGRAQHSFLASKHENCMVLALAGQRAGS
jgi:hypothetical protein